jgi:hypothetical protein
LERHIIELTALSVDLARQLDDIALLTVDVLSPSPAQSAWALSRAL